MERREIIDEKMWIQGHRYLKFGCPRHLCHKSTSEWDMADKENYLRDLGFENEVAPQR